MDSLVEPIFTRRKIKAAQKVVQSESSRLKSETRKANLLAAYNGQPVPPPAGQFGNLPAGGSHASLNMTPSLYPFQACSNFFLRHAGKEFIEAFFDLPNRYELLNSSAERILWAGETLEEFGNPRNIFGVRGPAFDVTLLGPSGGGQLSIYSHGQGITTVSDFHQILGTVVDTSSPFAPHGRYSVRDWNMSEIFKIRKSLGGKGEYEIFNNDNMSVGKFSNNWNTEIPNYVTVDRLYGFIVPEDMVPEQKCLLVGALFALFYQQLHFEDDRTDKCCAWILCLITPILIILAAVFLCIWFLHLA